MRQQVDSELLETLAARTRIVSLKQVARFWHPTEADPMRAARRTARRLIARGQVQQRTIMAVELSATEPLFIWQPGNRDAPEFNRLAWKNRKRWQQRLLRTECLIATPAAQDLYGGHTRPPRDRELNHDLHVAEVYLQLRKRAPERANAWRLEDELEQITQRQERPDAVIAGTPDTFIEVLGRGYGAAKLRALHGAYLHHPYVMY